jgi:DNA-3-methyladenine glycosylase
LTLRTDGSRPEPIMRGPRVGIRVGTDRPWRFWIDGDPCVSRTPSGSPSSRRRGSE